MNNDPSIDVAELIKKSNGGDPKATDQLVEILLPQLRQMASSFMRRERPNHTLQPSALVNEAYLKLVKQTAEWQGREHFLAIACRLMRQILIDSARAKHAGKRGGIPVSLDGIVQDRVESLWLDLGGVMIAALDLQDAIESLEPADPLLARILDLSFFGGMTDEEVARELKMSLREVQRDKAIAKAHLKSQLNPQRSPL